MIWLGVLLLVASLQGFPWETWSEGILKEPGIQVDVTQGTCEGSGVVVERWILQRATGEYWMVFKSPDGRWIGVDLPVGASQPVRYFVGRWLDDTIRVESVEPFAARAHEGACADLFPR